MQPIGSYSWCICYLLPPVIFLGQTYFKSFILCCRMFEKTQGEIPRLQCLMEKAGYLDMSRQCISCITISAGFNFGSLLKNCLLSNAQSNFLAYWFLARESCSTPHSRISDVRRQYLTELTFHLR